MALWTDIIDPATLTGYARASLEEYERRNGTLARWLPNRTVMDSVVRVVQGAHGLVDAAKFRAYDAEPETGRQKHGRRYTIELPALGQNIPVSEYKQLRERNASDEAMLNSIQGTTDQVVMAVANAIELMRGIVLATGKATIDQDNFKTEDDFAFKVDGGSAVTFEADGQTFLDPTFNGARIHQKIAEERFLYHCDRMGYLVWGEFPDWGVS